MRPALIFAPFVFPQIRCAAFDGHPAAQLSWEPPSDSSETEGRFDASAKPVLQKDEFHHTTTVFHTVKYRAELEDDDREITCLSTQVLFYYLPYLYGKPKNFNFFCLTLFHQSRSLYQKTY